MSSPFCMLCDHLGATDERESREVSVKEATVHNNNFEQLVSVSRDKEASVSVSHTYRSPNPSDPACETAMMPVTEIGLSFAVTSKNTP